MKLKNTPIVLAAFAGLAINASATSIIVTPSAITSQTAFPIASFSVGNLINETVTTADIDNTIYSNQFAFNGNNVNNDIWLDFGSTQTNFDSVLYGGRVSSSAANAENFKTMAFYFSNTDLNGVDLGTLTADETININFVGADNSVLEAFALAGTNSGRYVGIRTTGGGSNPGGRELRMTIVDPSTIPEPSSTALLGLGGLALILRRRK